MITMPQEFLTTEEMATLLKMSEGTVKRLLRTKQLPGYKISGVWRVDREEFERYLASVRNIQKEQK